ncbi:MAG: hypothetical protein CMK02_02655 [Polycyclovorans sp.]|nr:hypothetical protein [Polycyclovorans sp.]
MRYLKVLEGGGGFLLGLSACRCSSAPMARFALGGRKVARFHGPLASRGLLRTPASAPRTSAGSVTRSPETSGSAAMAHVLFIIIVLNGARIMPLASSAASGGSANPAAARHRMPLNP